MRCYLNPFQLGVGEDYGEEEAGENSFKKLVHNVMNNSEQPVCETDQNQNRKSFENLTMGRISPRF